MTKHLILLGDSIFDNDPYVPGEEPVVEQVREALGCEWKVTLLAVDGHMTSDVVAQLDRLPDDATHLLVSAGGNDALNRIGSFGPSDVPAEDLLSELTDIQELFRAAYRDMLQQVTAGRPATAVCTIYDQMPLPEFQLRRRAVFALSIFNDGIIREAGRLRVPVLDLREIFQDESDFSAMSPIEPSCEGGLKMAYAIARMLRDHDFCHPRSVVYH